MGTGEQHRKESSIQYTKPILEKEKNNFTIHYKIFGVFGGQILFSTTILHEFCVKIVKIMYNRQGRF